MPKPRFQMWLMAGLLMLVTITLYWPATRCDFVSYDDSLHVTANVQVQKGLTWESMKWAWSNPVNCIWHPLTVCSHMLDCQLFGLKPWGHHLTSVLLHALNAALVFALLQLMTGAMWRSLLVAALFAAHPLRVESVAWVSERKDVLSGFFGLLSLIAYARYAQGRVQKAEIRKPKAEGNPKPEDRSPKPDGAARAAVPGSAFDVGCSMFGVRVPSSIFYLLSLFFFALGLMSKPMLVTWPFVMLLLDYWPLGRMQNAECRPVLRSQSSGALRRADSTAEDGQYATPVLRNGTAEGGRNTQHASQFTAQSQIANRKSQILFPLLVEKLPFFVLAALGSVLTFAVQQHAGALATSESLPLGARTETALISYSRYLGKLFWPSDLAVYYPRPGQWSMGTLVLAAGLILGISVLVWMRRRPYPYLLMGWLWYCGTLLPVSQLVQTGSHVMADRYTYLPSLGVLILAVWGAYELTRCWRCHAMALPVAGGAAIILCLVLTRQQIGYWKDSQTLFRHALEVTENNLVAHNNLGVALLKNGQMDEAIWQFREAIRITPDGANAHENLASALLEKGQTDAAISQFQEAVRLKPESASTHYDFGIALVRKGQSDAAISQFQEAIRLRPGYPDALGAVVSTLAAQGKYAEAIRFYQAALRAQPDQEGVLNNLAWLLATCPEAAFRSGPEAVRLATRACESTGYAKPLLIGTLAAAQAEAGDFQAAIATAERAAALATTLHLEEVAAKNRELIQLYRQDQPFHEKQKITTDGHR